MTKKLDITATLKDVRSMTTSRYGDFCLIGEVEGDKKVRWSDGAVIRTSNVVGIHEKEFAVATGSSIYKVPEESMAWIKELFSKIQSKE